MMIFRFRLWAVLLLMIGGANVLAGEADIVGATISLTGEEVYRFDVTVSHADTGWEHYANAFEILDCEGNLLGTRVLAHPHVNEQPFTRSLTNVVIPESVTRVIVRATDSVHGDGGLTLAFERSETSWVLENAPC